MGQFATELSDFASGAVAPTSAAQAVARLSALDWAAVGLAGAGEPVAGLVRRHRLAAGGAPQAHIFGAGTVLPAEAAAQVNGTTSHALDYDDTHFAHIGHPSVAVFPAALAVAEARDLPLEALLEAALVGMELSVRVGVWLGRAHYQAGYHQTATAGAFGATAAAGRLLGLDTDRLQHAFGLCATRAAGLKAQFGTMGKPFNAGLAAAAGVETALLAAAGFRSNPDALDGPFGFGATHHGENAQQDALAGLGGTWLFEGVSHKFHACCHGLHAALEAARDMGLAAPAIETLEVRTHPRWMSVCNQPAPDTGLGAKFSYRTVLAMQALGHDTARMESYSDALCADAEVRALRERVTVRADETLSETEAVVTVRNRGGGEQRARHDLLTPMSLGARRERVRAKAASLLGQARAGAIWTLLQTGERAAELGRAISA